MKQLKCCTCLKVIWILSSAIRMVRIDAFTFRNVTTPSVVIAESSDSLPLDPHKKLPNPAVPINNENENLDEKPETTSELLVPSDEKLDKSETTSELPVPTDESPKKSVIKPESTSDLTAIFDEKSEQNVKKSESTSESPVASDLKSDNFDQLVSKPKTTSETSIQSDKTAENSDVRTEPISELPIPTDVKSEETIQKLGAISDLPMKPDENVMTATASTEQSVNQLDFLDNVTLSSDENLLTNDSINYVYQEQRTEKNETLSDEKLESVTELPIEMDVKPESSSEFTIYSIRDDIIIPGNYMFPDVKVGDPLKHLIMPSYSTGNITDDLIIPHLENSEILNARPFITELNLSKIYSEENGSYPDKTYTDYEFEMPRGYEIGMTIPLSNSNFEDNIVSTATRTSIHNSEESSSSVNPKESTQSMSHEDIFCITFVPLVVVISIIIYIYVSCRKQGSYTVNNVDEEYSLEQAREADSKF